MGSPQLYYTSCEHGLSGYSGYQFNAATPGVDPRVLREVERFTVYEPPRALANENVDRHPVNLCYSPDLGGQPVLSRVASSGDDPSGRPGNYFAHSLILGGGEESGEGPLPAELWGADFWAEAPVSDPELPRIDLPPGPLDRRRTGSWLSGHRGPLLERLLVAVDAAIDGGLPVLLLADDEEAAHWLAALSHLLPPGRARAMSFATYSGNPEETLVHVVAVPPHTDTHTIRNRFTVFDPGASPEDIDVGTCTGAGAGTGAGSGSGTGAGTDAVGATTPDTAAVVALLLRTGVGRTRALWSSARPFASGAERSLADWRPVLAAASLADGCARTSGPELSTVRAWLPEASSWLRREQTCGLLERLLDADGLMRGNELAALQRVAHAVGSDHLTERLEGVMVSRCLDGIATGSAAPPVSPVRSELVREVACERICGLLSGALYPVPEPDRALELLRWARAGELALPASVLERYGQHTVARRLAALPPAGEPGPVIARLLREHDAVRRGVAEGLLGQPRRVLAVLAAGPAGELFAQDRDGSTAVLRELRMLASGTDDPLRLLRGVVALRQSSRPLPAPGLAEHDLDEELLRRVWGPGQRPGTVLAVLGVVDERTLVAPGVGAWIAEALRRPPNESEDAAWREALRELARHRVGRLLPEEARGWVGQWAEAEAALAALDRAPETEAAVLLPEVARCVLAREGTAVITVASRAMADRLLRWQPEHAAVALSGCAGEVFAAYCRAVLVRLAPQPRRERSGGAVRRSPQAELAARVFRTARALSGGSVPQARVRGDDLLRQALEPALPAWSRRDLGKVRRSFAQGEGGRSDGGPEFEAWSRSLRERHGGSGLFARLRRRSYGK